MTELEEEIGNWTLASDSLLLDHLQDMSKRIQTRYDYDNKWLTRLLREIVELLLGAII